MIKRTCPECGDAMSVQRQRLDEEIWVSVVKCTSPACGYYEDVPADIEAHSEDRPRLAGL